MSELKATMIVIVIILLGSMAWGYASCNARWSDYDSSWGVFAGCRVKVDGKWIPEDRVRDDDFGTVTVN